MNQTTNNELAGATIPAETSVEDLPLTQERPSGQTPGSSPARAGRITIEYNDSVVRYFLIASVFWSLIGMAVGVGSAAGLEPTLTPQATADGAIMAASAR